MKQKGALMVTKVLSEVTGSIADAFSPRPRQSPSAAELYREINQIREVSSYSRERYLHESLCDREAVSERDIEIAVLEALKERRRSEQGE
jgi:hypothetical protein